MFFYLLKLCVLCVLFSRNSYSCKNISALDSDKYIVFLFVVMYDMDFYTTLGEVSERVCDIQT